MFEKFTEGAIKVIMLSQEEARRMGHNFVGTEQLLLGVIVQRIVMYGCYDIIDVWYILSVRYYTYGTISLFI